ncbi:BREX-1 system adenine-specific DNA-methyltransferase PglX [uncultured Pantoea sp.]|uniref:BREX-1 system adenine-specific DNA-methyltransferase PglX n=1 Tax=uncultured Pantoea sp. TaxID=218084 RepID=UPI0025D05F36|nr:BREX-1 system adenine-specific DNA-methyltransferase PglX [uncultured Pantoea sp.]
MNTSNIKKYAPVARKQFRDAVIQKLTTLGIEADKKGNLQILQATDLGDSVRYGQFTLEKSLTARRERLVKQAEKQGYEVLVEHIAYTWFNRFCAIRYMELHGYLDHGFRMLSHPTLEGGFEVLDHVPEVADALGLDKSRLVEMKLAGDRDEELYRELLLAQCHTLQGAMPFLFEAVNDDIELVLPDNLTRTDSILRGLVDTIPEEDWEQVEVIGWLYQFYISEKKADVIGKVVKSEDIPAATQLFTPNWIVQYLVQNSVGRQWLQTYPDSSLKGKMPYYIEPAEQTPEVQAQLAAITPSSIEPESIKVLDPACGSGHILTEAYNVLKEIYEERGYRTRDIPQLILENNIFGLDIDDRAAQLSGFAMLMLARQDDRRILTRSVRLNIVSLQESKLDIAELWTKLNFHQQVQRGSMGDMFAEGPALVNTDSAEYKLIMRTLALFTSAKTLGSLIQVSHKDEAALKAFLDGLYLLAVEGDIQQKEAAVELIPYIQQAWILAQRYDAVVANPPYMGSNFLCPHLKKYISDSYPSGKADIYSSFLIAAANLIKAKARLAFVTMHTWMFLANFKKLRKELLATSHIENLIHMDNGVMGISFQTSAYIINNYVSDSYFGCYKKIENNVSDIKNTNFKENFIFKSLMDFHKLPNQELAFNLDGSQINFFDNYPPLSKFLDAREGMTTADNEKYLRFWWEVNNKKIYSKSKDNAKWYPYQKGGEARKWYGNNEWVVNWEHDGIEIKNNKDEVSGRVRSHNYNGEYALKEGITWSAFSNGGLSFRFVDEGYLFDTTGSMAFSHGAKKHLLAYLNSDAAQNFLKAYSPSPRIKIESLLSLPLPLSIQQVEEMDKLGTAAVNIEKELYSLDETSPTFKLDMTWLVSGWKILKQHITDKIRQKEKIEQIIDSIVATALNITTQSESKTITNELFSNSDLISFSIGCMMGRYSLDREGLVYAHEGNKGFADLVDKGAYKTFPADEDGIMPLMDSDWFDDDVTTRIKEFVCVVWGEKNLQQNLDFIAESLSLFTITPKKGETSLDTLRRYLSTKFWKEHMKMYKKRPIYWLFSSGKEKAFECLVYLHRYNEGTLSRMRTEYVVPLLARYQGNIDLVNDQLKNSESGAATTRLKKELDGLSKKFNELRHFDDRLRHYADRRITIDLDDGVKINYGKFGDLLVDVKAITGSNPQEA